MNTVTISQDELDAMKKQVKNLTQEAVRLMGKLAHLTAKQKPLPATKQQALARANEKLQIIAEHINMSEEEASMATKDILSALHGTPHR